MGEGLSVVVADGDAVGGDEAVSVVDGDFVRRRVMLFDLDNVWLVTVSVGIVVGVL